MKKKSSDINNINNLVGKRPELYYFEPTEKWLQRRNPPLIRKEILAWFDREKKVLQQRLKGAVKRKFQYNTIVVDRGTKEILKRSKQTKETTVDAWKLSKADYEVYLASLTKRFETIKEKYNERVRAKTTKHS